MPNSHAVAVDEHANNIEAIGLGGPAMAVDPNQRGPGQLPLLTPVDRFYGISELDSATGLHFDERHRSSLLYDEIDVAVAIPEPAL
jgi:hypothetical protein